MAKQKDNSSDNTENKPVNINDTDSDAVYLKQKCTRLAGALYAVTRFFSPGEPLKETIRDSALSLVDVRYDSQRNVNATSEVRNLLDQIRDQLTVANDGNLISSMNYRILVREIDAMLDRLDGGETTFGPQLNDQYLSVAESELPSGRNKTTASSSSEVSDTDTTPPDAESTPRSAKERRRQKILELFADTEEITVNDVTEVISGYSTKTIQRDLKELVEDGTLEKHGKRRWTSYTRA